MSYTDFLRLNEHKIFKKIREGLPENVSESLNVLTVKDSVLFAWDFKDSNVLCLNISAARSRDGDNVIHQCLLPNSPPVFTPEFLVANDNLTLLAVAGRNGVLVMELPSRYPPHGAFDHNKEEVGCRSHSLDERLLLCSDLINVQQVKFHPGSIDDNHVVVLTTENIIRFYKIENHEAINLAVYQLGVKPRTIFPGSEANLLAFLGDTAVDFDFGQPEIEEDDSDEDSFVPQKDDDELERSLLSLTVESPDGKIKPTYIADTMGHDNKEKNWSKLVWPIYFVRGCGTVYSLTVPLTKKVPPKLRGPLPIRMKMPNSNPDACSILCLNTTPQILCCGFVDGTMRHTVVLPMGYDSEIPQRVVEEDSQSATLIDIPDKELLVFEIMQLELGLNAPEVGRKPKEQLHLHRDESKINRYYVTHATGVHSVYIPSVDDLQNFVTDQEDDDRVQDIFTQLSTAEYLICTQSAGSENPNPVVGFSPYYNPNSIITVLGNGSLVTMGILSTAPLPKSLELPAADSQIEAKTPLNKMLKKEPFDQYVQKLLKFSRQPILMLSTDTKSTQKDCYELLQCAIHVFREEYFPNHLKVKEEIEKRVKTLGMLKRYQLKEIEKMNAEKQLLQEKAENLAEKYEDIKDKQDELMKRCERLLILVSQRKSEPSDAELAFLKELKESRDKVKMFEKASEKLKLKVNYQRTKMDNWKSQDKRSYLTEMQENTIRHHLDDTTKKITELHKQVLEYKKQLNIP